MVKGKSKTSEDLKAKPKKKKSQIYQNQNGDMCRFTLVSGNSKPLQEQSLHSFNRQLLIEYLEYLLCASTVLNKP